MLSDMAHIMLNISLTLLIKNIVSYGGIVYLFWNF